MLRTQCCLFLLMAMISLLNPELAKAVFTVWVLIVAKRLC